MNERELARILNAIDQAGPALAERQRALASVDWRALEGAQRALAGIDRNTIAKAQRARAALAEYVAVIDKALRAGASGSVVDDVARALGTRTWAEWAQVLSTVESAQEVGRALSKFDIPHFVWEASRALRALDAAIADLRLSPEWEELFDDLSAVGEGSAPIEGDFNGSVQLSLAAHLAVPALIERIRELSAVRSEPRLDDAAWRLELEDARWRSANDDREFPIIIHGAASVLEGGRPPNRGQAGCRPEPGTANPANQWDDYRVGATTDAAGVEAPEQDTRRWPRQRAGSKGSGRICSAARAARASRSPQRCRCSGAAVRLIADRMAVCVNDSLCPASQERTVLLAPNRLVTRLTKDPAVEARPTRSTAACLGWARIKSAVLERANSGAILDR